MDKKTLQNSILEKAYQPSTWLEVMKDYFGAKKFHQKPQPVSLPSNEIAHTAFELGSFYTVDERLVGIYEVHLTDKALIERNRVGLRNLFKSIIRYDLDAALIVYVQDKKWRFSYVSEIRTAEGKKETEPKRYTYLFGEGESCRTAAERFDKLKGKPIYLNDLFEAFSVEKLNKEFFKIYKEFYEKFWKYLAANKQYNILLSDKRYKDDEVKREKPIRDFAKKLLGRIVFLQFLQKKGWMGVPAKNAEWKGGDIKFLQNLFANSKNKQSFHSNELRTLFFETLNEKRPNHLAPISLGKDIKIPYLNGGLFEKDLSYTNNIDFPEDYFAQLLDFFEQYNFTIDENDPYDSEVGIDPEMLGHIFENLLEENREKGAFYTPKEIVHYMCQESLIEYLHTQLPDYNKADIELLVRNNQVSPAFAQYKTANEVNNKLKAVKICDPAIGSGAFPMGLLKEIFECRRVLYGYLKTNEKFDPAQVKKEIIQQNIYGVDLENGAVEIARLRFWLALVVDETEPQPLPNLDYKIMQGNSLLESFAGIDLQNLMNADDEVLVEEKTQLTLGSEFDAPVKQMTIFTKAHKDELFTLIKKYFDPDEWENQTGEVIDKAAVKKQINDFVEGKIHAFILKCQRDLNKEIKAAEKKWKEAGVTDHSKLNQKSKEYKQYTDWKKQLHELDAIEEKLVALQKSDDKPYFLWHLWFKDVFDKGGFDIVIGNPPYIQLQKDGGSLAKQYENQGFETFERTGDIYSLFYEKGMQLLKNKGVLTYITSNKWMRAGYGKSTRAFFCKHNPLKLIDLGSGIFESATVDTNILTLQKTAQQPNTYSLQALDLSKEKHISSFDNYADKWITLTQLSADSWTIANEIEQCIKAKIERIGKPLKEWDIQINYGIKTGYNEAFIIDGKKKNELIAQDPKSAEIIKPILRGRDIKRYKAEFADLWLINTHNGVKEKNIPRIDVEKNYPAIYAHLKQFEPQLKKRQDKGDHWTNLRNCAYIEEFEKEKIIYPNMTLFLPFIYDNKGFYTNQKCFIITSKSVNLKFLTGMFNSKVSHRWIRENCPELQGGTRELSKIFFENLPIPQITQNQQRPFIALVEQILALKEQGKDTTALEQQIDHLVYKLYELTYEEVLVIDPAFPLSKEEYERIELK
ncbi:MAG: Eco57I restriction-modification methylase domain-containing protein [Bacteroidia bacterium]